MIGVPNASVSSNAAGGVGGSSTDGDGGNGGSANGIADVVASHRAKVSAVATGGSGGALCRQFRR